jgi:hypothetical protein
MVSEAGHSLGNKDDDHAQGQLQFHSEKSDENSRSEAHPMQRVLAAQRSAEAAAEPLKNDAVCSAVEWIRSLADMLRLFVDAHHSAVVKSLGDDGNFTELLRSFAVIAESLRAAVFHVTTADPASPNHSAPPPMPSNVRKQHASTSAKSSERSQIEMMLSATKIMQ